MNLDELLDELFELLNFKNLTIGVAESCTGGFLSNSITNREGASKIYCGGVVVYQNKAKELILGIDKNIISQYSSVSGEVTLLMAERIAQILNSDIGVGITGVLGEDEVESVSPGTVFISVAYQKGRWLKELCLFEDKNRLNKKRIVVQETVKFINSIIKDEDE